MDNRELITLVQIHAPNPPKVKTGLFHMAFVVPSRKDLANAYYLLKDIFKIKIQGACDHGSTEAIYLSDPEGNGIEIYREKTKEERNTKENRLGKTGRLDIDSLLKERDCDLNISQIPTDTKLGHVHLKVKSIDETEIFYSDILGLGLKRKSKKAIFFATGDYHHHVGANIWHTREASSIGENDLGLAYYTLVVPKIDEIVGLKKRFVKNNCEIFDEEGSKAFKVLDPSGITLKIVNT